MIASLSQFGTRITRRVVAAFALCALLPVVVTLLLAYDGVQGALLTERTNLLRGTAAQYGTSLVDRLRFAESMARVALLEVAGRRSLGGEAFQGYFRTAMTLNAAEARALFGTAADALDARPAAQRTLIVLRQPGKIPSIWLISRGSDADSRIALELDPSFLWGDADDLPYLTDICVFGLDGTLMRCSRVLSGAALGALRERLAVRPRGDLAWEDEGIRYLGGLGETFLRGRYNAESWIVVAIQPEEYALAPIAAVKRIMAPVLLLGLLVAALLGLIQVRRTLGPLKELSDATARIAVQDFSVRLGVERDDEFGALARAFNMMCSRLGRQFTALLAHAEIDAVILSNVDLPRVAEIVLRRVAELAPGGRPFLLLADPAAPRAYRRYSAACPEGEPVSVSHTDAGVLLAASSGRQFTAADPQRPECLAEMPGTLFVLPIALGTELGGVIVLGYDDDRPRAGEEIAILSKLGDRVAVALATARRDLELHRRAHYDSLTRLPNRLLGVEELRRALAAAARYKRSLAVLFVDLDAFSDVNDSLGHEAGDRLLVQAAERLRGCVRKSDVVARLGGDEFAVVLTEVKRPGDAAVAARHALNTLCESFRLGGASAFVSASIGIAIYPEDGDTAELLLRHADLAMYSAKQEGRGNIAFFEPSMNQEVRLRIEAERELREALEKNEFELYYQPQLELSTGRIQGVEALIRWRHPSRGLVPPADFIAYAEASGLIEPMGVWALHAACAQYAAWRAAQLPIERISVNVSPRQFRNPELAWVIGDALQRHAVPPGALLLEITESALLGDEPTARATLEKLGQLGVALELDDFGTGYSSLARLQRLPVAGVKLDQAFIGPIEKSAGAQAVVRAAIEMAHALGKYVVAEGVESAAQRALLSDMACDFVQGYILSPPVPAAKLEALFREKMVGATA